MLRVLYFGMTGVFSTAPLGKLLESSAEVAAVVLPASSTGADSGPHPVTPVASSSELPLLNPHLEHNAVHIAWEYDIPVWEIGDFSTPPTLNLLKELQPDLIVVACFSQIFPSAVLRLPRYGCLNLHPSLLPAYRGPLPLFWMARQGEPQAGVTLHFMDEGVDSGDIVSQRAFAWPEGQSEAEIERHCAEAGGQLLVEAVHQLEMTGHLARQPQPKAGASYFSWPSEADLCVSTAWSAKRAFNFIRFAADKWPVWIDVAGQQVFVREALGYAPDRNLAEPLLRDGDALRIQFTPGVLHIQAAAVF